jgi:hypothetical protein
MIKNQNISKYQSTNIVEKDFKAILSWKINSFSF